MTRTRIYRLLGGAAALALSASTLAACGGGGNSTAATPAHTTASGSATTLAVADSPGLGKILVDSNGLTVYLFKSDTATKSTCTGACATAWPPVRVSGKPSVGSGLSSSKVGTITRSDGKPQVTYNGHPLYLFQGDSAPGQANGEGSTAFGAAWLAVSPAGDEVNGTPSSSGGAGGY